jgi:hypothetical protein
VVLKYVYAGRDEEAWEFFERQYKLGDKAEVRALVEELLRSDAIYQSMH